MARYLLFVQEVERLIKNDLVPLEFDGDACLACARELQPRLISRLLDIKKLARRFVYQFAGQPMFDELAPGVHNHIAACCPPNDDRATKRRMIWN